MIYFVLFILLVSACLYIVLAGADLGAGILEIFKGKTLRQEQERLITKAMGPVWEANHIWLILMIVILFVGFPKIFSTLSTIFHIPITAFLIGIIMRGSAFTFRHYDAIQDRSQRIYSLVFAYSSLWVSVWMGIIVGALILGHIPGHGEGFVETYILSWLHPFTLLVGLFLATLVAYVSATFMVAESSTHEARELFKKRAVAFSFVSVVLGALVFLYGFFYEIATLENFFRNWMSLVLFSLSTSLLVVQGYCIKKGRDEWLKFIGAFQLILILLGWVVAQFPNIYTDRETGVALNILLSSAPHATMVQLTIALAVGCILIFPPYIYLMWIFKKHL